MYIQVSKASKGAMACGAEIFVLGGHQDMG